MQMFRCLSILAILSSSSCSSSEVDPTSSEASVSGPGAIAVQRAALVVLPPHTIWCIGNPQHCICALGYGNCDANMANGCEVNLNSSPSHCGRCGTVCPPGWTCTGGACANAACDAGSGDCDANPANGCEVDLLTDTDNCGTCGAVCTTAHGTPACDRGKCTVGSCVFPWGDCDRDPRNGCETSLTVNGNCGACASACLIQNGVADCSTGACKLGSCLPGYADCDGVGPGCEVNLNTTPNHCGACGAACTALHGVPGCSNAQCTVAACDVGWGNCDAVSTNGCEADLYSDSNNCSACDLACATGASCVHGACTSLFCSDGHADCDSDPFNGCEVDLNTDANRCGQCTLACSVPNATPVCSQGSCEVGTCNAGWGDCDGVSSNGCEAHFGTSSSNCGACGVSCAPKVRCVSGQCRE